MALGLIDLNAPTIACLLDSKHCTGLCTIMRVGFEPDDLL
jgi:hypothetical protein